MLYLNLSSARAISPSPCQHMFRSRCFSGNSRLDSLRVGWDYWLGQNTPRISLPVCRPSSSRRARFAVFFGPSPGWPAPSSTLPPVARSDLGSSTPTDSPNGSCGPRSRRRPLRLRIDALPLPTGFSPPIVSQITAKIVRLKRRVGEETVHARP